MSEEQTILDTKKELSTIELQVEDVLAKHDQSRNSDKVLIWAYILEETGIELDLELLKSLPSFESLTRARRKIQDGGEGIYLSDSQIADKKKLKQEAFRQWSRE